MNYRKILNDNIKGYEITLLNKIPNNINRTFKVEYICTCGIENIKSMRAINQYGILCQKCIKNNKPKKYRTQEEFIKEINNIFNKNGKIHNYENTLFKSINKKISYICIKHKEEISQRASSHINGETGCKKCAYEKLSKINMKSLEYYKEKGREHFNNKFTYVSIKSKKGTGHAYLSLICNIHNKKCEQRGSHHIIGTDPCSKCHISGCSKGQIEWLEYMMKKDNTYIQHYKNEKEYKIKVNGKFTKVDGYSKELNKIYEYDGDFWHGNPKYYKKDDINKMSKKKYGVLYEKTLTRVDNLKSLGYIVESIWESEWIFYKKMIKK